MTDKLEDKNDFSTKGISDILNPDIVEKLEKMENIGPVFQGNNINSIINILFKNHELDLITYLDFKLKLSILEELVTIENKLEDID
jgi:hypothetical protein